MKKLLSALLATTMLATLLAACGGSTSTADTPAAADDGAAEATAAADEGEDEGEAEEAPPAANGETFTMQIGHAQATTSPRHISLETFKETVESKTGGGVTIEIYPAGQLGDENEMTDAVAMGTLQAVRGGALEQVPQVTTLSLPMLFDDIEQVHEVFYSDYVMNMLGTVEDEYGLKVLAVGDDSGFRQITNNVREITSPDDMKGLKMRTVLEIIELSMQAFGASTVSIPFTDLYMSLKTGVADGQENPLALIDNQKFYEVQSYCTIIDYMVMTEIMYVNLDWFNSLPAEYQTILTEAAKEMMDETSRIVEEENAQYIENIKNNGCEVTVLTEEQRESFRPAAEEVWKQYVDLGYMTREELDNLLELVGKTVDW